MKRISIIIVLVTGLGLSLYAQDTLEVGFNKHLYKKIINKEFANLISPQSKNILGNFAALDLKESEVNFAGNHIFENGSILGLKAKGGSSDGILPIFSDSEFSSKVGLDVQYNFLCLSKKELYYYSDDFDEYLSKKRKVNNQFIQKYNDIIFKKDSLKLIEEIHSLRENQLKILLRKKEIELNYDSIVAVSAMEKVIIQRNEIEKQIVKETNKYKIDSLNIELSKILLKIEYQKSKLNNFNDFHSLKVDSVLLSLTQIDTLISQKEKELKLLSSQSENENRLRVWKAEEIKKIQKEINILGFQIGWFSLGYGIKNNSFLHVDSSVEPDKQVNKKSYLNHNINFQYSYYKYSPFAYNSIYASLGISMSIEDNFDELSKKEISEKQEIGDTISSRTITKSYSAYSGKYKTDMRTVSIYGDFYYFLFEKNLGAIHFYPEYKFKEEYKPQINLGVGFLMTYKGKDKNVINAEIYYNMIDIENNNKSDYNLFSRSQLGMRFTFPIVFNPKSS